MRPGLVEQAGDVLLLIGARPADGDAEHAYAASHAVEAGEETGLRAAAAGGVHDPVDPDAEIRRLLQDLQRAADIAQRTDRVRAAAWNDIGPAARAAHLVGSQRAGGRHRAVARYIFQSGAEQAIEQDVAVVAIGVGRLRDALFQDEHAFQPELRGRCRRLSRVVGLQGAQGDQRVGALLQGVGHQIFQLARLVAAGGEPRAVVALDPELRPAEVSRETGHRLSGVGMCPRRTRGKRPN